MRSTESVRYAVHCIPPCQRIIIVGNIILINAVPVHSAMTGQQRCVYDENPVRQAWHQLLEKGVRGGKIYSGTPYGSYEVCQYSLGKSMVTPVFATLIFD